MAHPDTYLNKIAIGSQEGRIQLWNFASGKMLYEFTGFAEGAVKCIAPSPALDVVGIGMSSGCASLSLLSQRVLGKTPLTTSSALLYAVACCFCTQSYVSCCSFERLQLCLIEALMHMTCTLARARWHVICMSACRISECSCLCRQMADCR